MKKVLSVLVALCLMGSLVAGINASAASFSGTGCNINANGTVSVGNSGYYSLPEFTYFSKGESASLTISVDQLGTNWYDSGLVIVVNSQRQDALDNGSWQGSGMNGIFTLAFAANDNNAMEGVIYRCGENTGRTEGAGWATASLSEDITIEIKQNAAGVTALYLNGNEWTPYVDTGLVIPDGHLAIATSAGSKVTVKSSTERPSFNGTACSVNSDGSVSVENNGYYSLTKYTAFSQGESASFTMSVDQLGTDWFAGGLVITVTSACQESLDAGAWQGSGMNGIFTLAFVANASNQMEGVIYRCGENTGRTEAAGWATASLGGEITVEVKQNATGVTALYLNGSEWVPYESTGLAIPDGYLAIATAAGSKVTVANSNPVAPFTDGTAGILNTLVKDKQALRFNHSLTTTVDKTGETVTVGGKTYTVDKIGMLVSKRAGIDMKVGNAGVLDGYVSSARSIVRNGNQVTYNFSILVKNIDRANKDTNICARPYLLCKDGTILYGNTQVTSVSAMYTVLSQSNDFPQTVDDWMEDGWTQLFKDNYFEKGIEVVSVDRNNEKIFNFGDPNRQNGAIWSMVQHFSKYDLITEEPVFNADGSVSYENDGKRVTMSQENGENVLQMEMFASNEYDAPRQEGEAWPHLLIEQNLGSQPIDTYDQIVFSMTVRKDYVNNEMGDDYIPEMHCYQTGMVFVVQNMNTQSAGYGEDFFWFSVPCFNSKEEYAEAFCGEDDGKEDASGKLIYMLGGKEFYDNHYTANPGTNEGQWCTVTVDILPELLKAFNKAKEMGYMPNTNWEDLRLQGVNFGCESTGTFDASVSIKNVSILCHEAQ